MDLVIIESPYAPTEHKTTEQNVEYARACMKDSLLRGEAPYASHLLYTQEGVLDDTVPTERALGIRAGFEFKKLDIKTVFYLDYGMSKGMALALAKCKKENLPYDIRYILKF